MGIIFSLVELAIAVLCLAGMWKTFEKAGKPGWAAIVPIYNMIIVAEIIGKPLWWFIIACIPVVNIVVFIPFAAKFGKTSGFGIGLALLSFIFFPMLGFSDAQFNPAGQPSQGFQAVMPPNQ